MKKNEKNKDNKKGKKTSIKMKTVEVDINDVLELAKKIVMEGNGGIGIDSVNYIGIDSEIKSLKFTIPDMTEKGKCNNLCLPEQEDYDKEGGCGETGGSCICGEKEDHEGDCVCKLCGHEF